MVHEKSHDDVLVWSPEAQARLDQVPEGVMRELTRQRVEKLARQRGESIVTPAHMDAKYRQWSEGSARAAREMAWTDEARERLERIPPFVRGMVMKAIEEYAGKRGVADITAELMEETKGYWGVSGRFHKP